MRLIDRLASSPPAFTSELTSAKGLFFVHLYGAYEYTVAASVMEAIRHVNLAKPKIVDCQPLFLSLALDSECKSLADVGPDKTWDRRRALFGRIGSQDGVEVPETLMPTAGGNPDYEHLCSIWETFCIGGSAVPSPNLIWKIKELVEKRNAIAHGRETASAVGGRFSISDLDDRYSAISAVCSHVIEAFKSYLSNGGYLRISGEAEP